MPLLSQNLVLIKELEEVPPAAPVDQTLACLRREDKIKCVKCSSQIYSHFGYIQCLLSSKVVQISMYIFFKATGIPIMFVGKREVEEELELKGSVNKSFCVIQVDGNTTQK